MKVVNPWGCQIPAARPEPAFDGQALTGLGAVKLRKLVIRSLYDAGVTARVIGEVMRSSRATVFRDCPGLSRADREAGPR